MKVLISVFQSEWVILETLATNVENTGSFVFAPADFRCSGDDCEWYTGAVKLTLRSGDVARSVSKLFYGILRLISGVAGMTVSGTPAPSNSRSAVVMLPMLGQFLSCFTEF